MVSDSEVKEWLAAQQIQLDRDFTPAWGVAMKLRFVGRSERVSGHEALLVFLDTTDEATALGYHYESAQGTPLGKVFVKTCIESGLSWTVCASHEALELAGDPNINLLCLDASGTRAYVREMCDAVEADELGYRINGVLLSDFVLPSYFDPEVTVTKAHKRSFCGHVTKPFEVAPGGYMSYIDLTNLAGGWQQLDRRAKHRPGSRRVRREMPESERKRSTGE
jgi:hypothetical protein